MFWYLACALLFLGSGFVSFCLTPFWEVVARRLGVFDHPGPSKPQAAPVPYLGGLAMAGGFLATVVAGLLGAWLLVEGALPPPPGLDPADLLGVGVVSGKLGALLLGGCAMLLLGLADDLRAFSPGVKLAAQALICGAVALFFRATFFAAHPLVGYLLTVAWLLVVTNTVNLLDNTDGAAAGVCAIAACVFALAALGGGHWFVGAALSALAGAAAGFLPWNWHPARIYMGDAGSLWLGFNIGALAVLNTYYTYGEATPVAAALPVFVLAVPLFDSVRVVAIRLAHGVPVWRGDRRHLAHSLVEMGLPLERAVVALYLLTLATAAPALLLDSLTWGGVACLAVQTVSVLAVVWAIERGVAG